MKRTTSFAKHHTSWSLPYQSMTFQIVIMDALMRLFIPLTFAYVFRKSTTPYRSSAKY